MARKRSTATEELNLPSLLDSLQDKVSRNDELVTEQTFRTYKDVEEGKFLSEDGKLLPAYELGIRLKMCGMNLGLAAHHAKITPGNLIKVGLTEEGKRLQAQVRTELDWEFKNLQSEVISAVAKGLRSEEPQAYLGAANLWFKVEKENKLTVNLTAEDIIKELLERRENGTT